MRKIVEVSTVKDDAVGEEVMVQVLAEETEATVGAVEVEGIGVDTGEDVAALRENLMRRERRDIVEGKHNIIGSVC